MATKQKEKQSICLFSNYYGEGWDFETVKQDYIEMNDVNPNDIGEGFIYSRMADLEEQDREMCMNILKDKFGDNKIIIRGVAGFYNGNFECYNIYNSVEAMIYAAIKDCEMYRISLNAGHVVIESSHHDGNNYFEAKILNERGFNQFDNWKYGIGKSRELSHYDFLNYLWNTRGLTRKIKEDM